MSFDHQPPHNFDAEQAVLGSVLIDPDAIHKVMTMLRGKDFFNERHRWIWEAAVNLAERHQPVDYVALVDELERNKRLDELGGSTFIVSLINAVPTAANVESYATIVDRMSTLRRLISASGEIAGMAYKNEGDLDEIIDRSEQLIFQVTQRKLSKELVPISTVVHEVANNVERMQTNRDEYVGVQTHFSALDKQLGGLQKSDLIIIAGRPSIGKTSFALNLVQNAAMHLPRKTVAVFSLEMANEQIVQRMIANMTGIDGQRLRLGQITDEETDRLTEAIGRLSEAPIYLDDTPAASPNEIRSKARRLAAERGLEMIVIDYLQLMRGSERNENRVQEIAGISRSLKALARELRVPVVALSQLSRAVESRPDKHPQLSDLRESGSIEQDADVVMFLYRDDAYDKATERPNIAEVIVAKHRNGPTGSVSLHFNRASSRFADLEYYREEDAEMAF
ncbi:MAG: replicative DNA helicase [Chloroflexi bacterium]|nr:replicative DNA helicase [Chloroflexota bacterium]